jgi:hypothetical protein
MNPVYRAEFEAGYTVLMTIAELDMKLVYSVLAFLVGTAAYIPYVRGMLAGRTKPHAYTWLIWSITLAIATAGLWYGGGGYAAVNLSIISVLTAGIYLLSLKYGTKNVTRGDFALLALTLAAVVPWIIFKDPTLSVLMVTAIDTAGYIPSMRKSFAEPWSESLVTWAMFTLMGLFLILALDRYNLLTVIYIGASMVANLILIGICLVRRQAVSKP